MASRKIPKLQYWAQKYAMQYWGRPVTHPVVWDKKTKAYDGYVKHNGKEIFKIGMSPRTIYKEDNFGFHKVLRHELCHYFFVIDGIKHSEQSHVFIEELKRVDGSLPYRVTARYWHCRGCDKFLFQNVDFSWKLFERCSCGNKGVYCKRHEGVFITEGHSRKPVR